MLVERRLTGCAFSNGRSFSGSTIDVEEEEEPFTGDLVPERLKLLTSLEAYDGRTIEASGTSEPNPAASAPPSLQLEPTFCDSSGAAKEV